MLLESDAGGTYFSLSALRCYATFNSVLSEKSQSCFYFLVTISLCGHFLVATRTL